MFLTRDFEEDKNIFFFICARQEPCLDGGHCGLGKWVQTMCLVKFEIDPGRNTIDVKWNLHISLSNGHRCRPDKCQLQKPLAVKLTVSGRILNHLIIRKMTIMIFFGYGKIIHLYL